MPRQKKIKEKTKKQKFLDLVTDKDFKMFDDTNGIIRWNAPYRFPDANETCRPKCLNSGCYNPVALFRGKIDVEKGRELRTVCGTCHEYGYKGLPLKLGVVSYKKDYCENEDGHLGFPCTSTIHGSHVLELDHIDGNHLRNLQSNVHTLCKICHAEKSRRAGDHRKSTKGCVSPTKAALPAPHSSVQSKTVPILGTSNPCTQLTLEFEIHAPPGPQPISPFLIS